MKRYWESGCKGTLKKTKQTSTTQKCVQFGSIETKIVFGLGTVGKCGQYHMIYNPYVLYKVVPMSISLFFTGWLGVLQALVPRMIKPLTIKSATMVILPLVLQVLGDTGQFSQRHCGVSIDL